MTVVKRGLLVVAGLLILIVMALAIIPFFIDIDKYRPEIIKLVNENVNGEAEIGKLGLSLWGRVEVEINGVKLKDSAKKVVAEMDRAYVYFPFSSLIKGTPELTLSLNKPGIFLEKQSDGTLNILNLAKSQTPSTATPDEKDVKEPEVSGEGMPVDNRVTELLRASKVDFEIREATVHYLDNQSEMNQKVEGLNLLIRDISLSRPLNLEFWADLNSIVSDIKMNGPVRIDGVINPVFKGTEFESAEFNLLASLDKLVVTIPDVFQKSDQHPLNLKLEGRFSPAQLQLNQLLLKALNISLRSEGTVDLQPSLKYQLIVQSEPFDIKELEASVLPLKGLLKGPTMLAFDGTLETDSLKRFQLELKGPATDLSLLASVRNFAAPQISIDINSKSINLNELLILPEPVEEAPAGTNAETEKNAKSGAEEEATVAKGPDIDQKLGALRENAFLKALVVRFSTKIEQFIYDKLEVNAIQVKTSFKDLIASLETLSLKVFNGQVKMSGRFDLAGEKPKYGIQVNIDKIEIENAVKTQFESFANTLLGNLYVETKGEGQSLNPDQILPNLNIKGNFRVEDASFATVDVAKMINQGMTKTIESVRGKFPQVSDNALKPLSGKVGKYKQIRSGFSLAKGVFVAPDFHAEPDPNNGVDIKGYTEFGLMDDRLKADWRVIDTYNLTNLKSVGLDYNGVKVNSILTEEGQPVWLPIKVGCKLSEPCYQYDSIPGHFLSIAGKRLQNQVGDRLKREAQARVEEEKRKLAQKIAEEKKKAEEKAKQKAKEEAKDKAQDLIKKKLPF